MRNLLYLLLPLLFLTACNAQPKGMRDIDVAEATKLIAEGGWEVVDVRTPEEFAEGHLKDASNINYFDDDFRKSLDELPKDKSYIMYCHSGNRSGKAHKIMKELGFETVFNLKGGMTAWKRSGGEVVQ